MQRRTFVKGIAATGILAGFPFAQPRLAYAGTSVDSLPPLEGDLTLYLGRGEGGLYENVLNAIEKRNPKLRLKIRRGGSAQLANTLVAEHKMGLERADLFWAVDTGSIGTVTETGAGQAIPERINAQLNQTFQYPNWVPITGRVRTLPYNPKRVSESQIPHSIMALANSSLKFAWAPAYSSFQSFITAMRILHGEKASKNWLKAIDGKAKKYAGELGVVMAVERGEVDIGFANHYYTLRLKAGKPDANVQLAYTKNDAGCLLNTSGIVTLSKRELPFQFIQYLLSNEVQSYLAREAYEIPLVQGVENYPEGLSTLDTLSPPSIDLRSLATLRPTLNMMRDIGVL